MKNNCYTSSLKFIAVAVFLLANASYLLAQPSQHTHSVLAKPNAAIWIDIGASPNDVVNISILPTKGAADTATQLTYVSGNIVPTLKPNQIRYVPSRTPTIRYGIDSLTYTINGGTAQRIYIFIYRTESVTYYACPRINTSMPQTQVSITMRPTTSPAVIPTGTTVAYTWWDAETGGSTPTIGTVSGGGMTFNLIKDDSDVQTVWVQAVWNGHTFPRVRRDVYLGTECGTPATNNPTLTTACDSVVGGINFGLQTFQTQLTSTGQRGEWNTSSSSFFNTTVTAPASWSGNGQAPRGSGALCDQNTGGTGSYTGAITRNDDTLSFVFAIPSSQLNLGTVLTGCWAGTGRPGDTLAFIVSLMSAHNQTLTTSNNNLLFRIQENLNADTEIYSSFKTGSILNNCIFGAYGFDFYAPEGDFWLVLYNRPAVWDASNPRIGFFLDRTVISLCPAYPEIITDPYDIYYDVDGEILDCIGNKIRVVAKYEDKGMLGGIGRQMMSMWQYSVSPSGPWDNFGPIFVYPENITDIRPYFEIVPNIDESVGYYRVVIAGYKASGSLPNSLATGEYDVTHNLYNALINSGLFAPGNPCNVVSADSWHHFKTVEICVIANDELYEMNSGAANIICNIGQNDIIRSAAPCIASTMQVPNPPGATYKILTVTPSDAGSIEIRKDNNWTIPPSSAITGSPLTIYSSDLNNFNPHNVNIRFTPAAGFCGKVEIEYEINCDGGNTGFGVAGLIDTATLTINMLIPVIEAKDIFGTAEYEGEPIEITFDVENYLEIAQRAGITSENVVVRLKSATEEDLITYATQKGTFTVNTSNNNITYKHKAGEFGLDSATYYVKCVENPELAEAKIYIYTYNPLSELYYLCEGDNMLIGLNEQPSAKISFEWTGATVHSQHSNFATVTKNAEEEQIVNVKAIFDRGGGLAPVEFGIYTFILHLGICREDDVEGCFAAGRTIYAANNISNTSPTHCVIHTTPTPISDYCPGAELAVLAKINTSTSPNGSLHFIVYDGTSNKILATYITGALEAGTKYYGFQFPTTTSSVKISICDSSSTGSYTIEELFVKECVPQIIINDGAPVIACLEEKMILKATIRAGSLLADNMVQWLRCDANGLNCNSVNMPAGTVANSFADGIFTTVFTSNLNITFGDEHLFAGKYKVGIKTSDECEQFSDVFEVRVETCGYSLAVQSGRWSDSLTWYNKRTPNAANNEYDAVIRTGVIVYTGSSSKSFGGRAFGRGANSTMGTISTDWQEGPNESELNLNTAKDTAKLANIVTIQSGAALILGHNLNASAGASAGVNNPDIVLSFGKIINDASSEAISANGTHIFDWMSPSLWANFGGLHIMAGAPLTTVARIGNEDISIANNGYMFVNGNITAEQRIYNANSKAGIINVAGGKLTVEKDFINGNGVNFTGTLNVMGGNVEVREWFRNGFLANSAGNVTISGGVVDVATSATVSAAKFLNGSGGDATDAGYAQIVGTANLTVNNNGVLNINRSLYNGNVASGSNSPANISVVDGKVTVRESVKSFEFPASNGFNISGGRFVMTGTPTASSDASSLIVRRAIVVSGAGRFIIDKNRIVNMAGLTAGTGTTGGGLIFTSTTSANASATLYNDLESSSFGEITPDNVLGSLALLSGATLDVYATNANQTILLRNDHSARNNVYFHRGVVGGEPSLVSFRGNRIMPTVPTHPYGKLRILNSSASLTIDLFQTADEICIGGKAEDALFHVSQGTILNNKIVFVDADANATFSNTFTHIRPNFTNQSNTVVGTWNGIIDGTVERRTVKTNGFGNATVANKANEYRFTHNNSYFNFSKADEFLENFALTVKWETTPQQVEYKDSAEIRAQRRYKVDFKTVGDEAPAIKTISLNYRGNGIAINAQDIVTQQPNVPPAEIYDAFFAMKHKFMFGAGFDDNKEPALLARVNFPAPENEGLVTGRRNGNINYQYRAEIATGNEITLLNTGTPISQQLVSGNDLIMFLGENFVSTRNGRWSDSLTWNYGIVPEPDDEVEIRHIVYTGMWDGSGVDVLFGARGWGEAEDKLYSLNTDGEALLAKKVRIVAPLIEDQGSALIIGAHILNNANLSTAKPANSELEAQRMNYTVPLVFGDIILSDADNSGIEIKAGAKENVYTVDAIMDMAKNGGWEVLKGLYILCNQTEGIVPIIRAIHINNSGLIYNMGIIEVGK